MYSKIAILRNSRESLEKSKSEFLCCARYSVWQGNDPVIRKITIKLYSLLSLTITLVGLQLNDKMFIVIYSNNTVSPATVNQIFRDNYKP